MKANHFPTDAYKSLSLDLRRKENIAAITMTFDFNLLFGWHFSSPKKRLRDGTKVVEGRTYYVDGPIQLCVNGLHFSQTIHDAANFARHSIDGYLHRVIGWGDTIIQDDKLVCRYRKVLWSISMQEVQKHPLASDAFNQMYSMLTEDYQRQLAVFLREVRKAELIELPSKVNDDKRIRVKHPTYVIKRRRIL